MAKKARANQTDAVSVPAPASSKSLMARLAVLQEELAQQVRQQEVAAEPRPEPQVEPESDAAAPARGEPESQQGA